MTRVGRDAEDAARRARPPVAFYCVTGRDFFPGAVALVNSLRLLGHDEPLFMLDCGMDPDQRALLAPHCEILPAPERVAPSLLKLVAPLARPADAMAILDADVIATRPLTALLDLASAGRLVGFENDKPRFFEQWRQILDLPSMRRGPYMSSSALFVGGGIAEPLLAEVRDRQARIELEATWLGDGDESHPLFYADQDVLNAVALSRLSSGQVVAFENRLAAIPPFAGLRADDRSPPHCAYEDATQPYLLHHYYRKPWLVRMRSNIYSRLLTRLLLGPDVAVRLGETDLPLRLRTGPGADASRLAVDLLFGVPSSVARRLRSRPREIKAWTDSDPAGDSVRTR